MSGLEILGRDAVRGAYRVAIGEGSARIVARVPEHLIGTGQPLIGGHGHRRAYTWLAAQAKPLEAALQSLGDGRRPKAPFDQIELESRHAN